MRYANIAIFALIPLLGLTLQSCKRPERVEYQERLKKADDTTKHAIHSDRLKVVMKELNRLTTNRLPQELDLNVQRQRRVKEVGNIALAMAKAADTIPKVLKESTIDLNEAEQVEFKNLAKSLHDQSMALNKEVNDISIEEMTQRLISVLNSCNNCHERFRLTPIDTTQ